VKKIATRSSGAVLVSGYWETQSGAPTSAPGSGKYRADNWATPSQLAMSPTDADGYNRYTGLLSLKDGDEIIQTASNDSQNYQRWSVVSVVDQGTWVQVNVSVTDTGSAFAAPGSNQSRLLQALQVNEVTSTPPGAFSSMPPLATPDDIIARLGRNLNQTEAARVDALLQDGSAIIRRYAREDFLIVNQDVIVVPGDAGIITVPNTPVISIDKLVALSGIIGVSDMEVTWYRFDGIETILVPDPIMSGIINLPEYWYEALWSRQSFELTHTHGYGDTPPEVEGLLCNAIISELSTPTLSATVQSESIGAYSYSMRRRAIGGGLYATLTDFGMQSMLSDYRKSQGTIAVRF